MREVQAEEVVFSSKAKMLPWVTLLLLREVALIYLEGMVETVEFELNMEH